jgi:hypothetical protein
VVQVDDQGTVTFSDLEQGVYLVMQEDAFQNSGDILPFLVAIPQEVDGEMRYHVDASPKVTLQSWTDPGTDEVPTASPEVSPTVSPEVSPTVSPEVSVTPETSPGVSDQVAPVVSPAASARPTVSPGAAVSPSPGETGATLPQTGQLNWPIPLMALIGLLLLLMGWRLYRSMIQDRYPKRMGGLCTTLGGVLILAALTLFLGNQRENHCAQENSSQALEQVKAQIIQDVQEQEETPGMPEIVFLQKSEVQEEDAAMPEVEIDGNVYIGYLSIPTLEIELPVQSQWSYENLTVSPCRYYGAIKSRDLVIAAHNYTAHFGQIAQLLP